ncbi:MAG: phosphatase [Verrucomicrobiales bacterium VVV1]|nr:MAG: phosphatase [Verrucomicrobiales bacterium VVV1]
MNRRGFLATTLAIPGTLAAADGSHENARLRFGLITDAQYADAEPKGERHYRATPEKLKAAVADLATRKLPFTLHLGDFIDHDFKSFATMLPLLEPLGHPVFHLLGNHDYDLTDAEKSRVVQTLDMPHDYYTFRRNGVRFLMLDTNALSVYKHPSGSPGNLVGKASLEKLTQAKQPGAQPYNGGIDDMQFAWMDRELRAATAAGDIVLVCAHHPLLPAAAEQMWNPQPVLELLLKYPCVKAWLNGHNHAGAYELHEGLHCVTFRSILHQPETNAWSTVTVHDDRLIIEGHGREVSRDLPFRS